MEISALSKQAQTRDIDRSFQKGTGLVNWVTSKGLKMPKSTSGCGGPMVTTSENPLSHELLVEDTGEEALLAWSPLSPSPA